jgi:hypothetical protein
MLIQEEMRRVLEYMSWFANWWTSHAAVPSKSIAHDPYLSEGFTAYAAKQADLRLSLRNHFQILWENVQTWLGANEVPGMDSMSDHDDDDN